MSTALTITCGTIRALTRAEKKPWASEGYCWVVVTPYSYQNNGICITVPSGFLTDGSTGGPDCGCSWLFHDWLYATHCFDPKENEEIHCSRSEADEIMKIILENERLSLYLKGFNFLSGIDFGWCFSRAWDSSGKRGPHLLVDELPGSEESDEEQ